jgi:transcriptional regulator with XRE-family HTH domain
MFEMSDGSTYADRVFWARTVRGIGPTKLVKATGCSQALLNYIEKNNSDDPGKYGKKFAVVFGVEPKWLVEGDENLAPPGWDARVAREARETVNKDLIFKAASVVGVELAPKKEPPKGGPAWSHLQATMPEAPPLAPLSGADRLMPILTANIMEYRRLAGTEAARQMLAVMGQMIALADEGAAKAQGGQDKVARPFG